MLEHVLTVAGAEQQLTQQTHQLRVQAAYAGLEGGLFAGELHLFLDLRARALHRLLDATGMDAPVGDEGGQRHARDLTAHRIEAREHHRLGSIVHDQVDTGGLLEGANIAPLAADNPSLHVIAGQRNDGDGALGGVIDRATLDRSDDDLVGLAVGLLARLGHGLTHELIGVLLDLLFNLCEQHLARFLAGHSRDPLQFPLPLLH